MTKAIKDLATKGNAAKYAATYEKFIFCLDLLDLSLIGDGDEYCEFWVNKLEDRFDVINANG